MLNLKILIMRVVLGIGIGVMLWRFFYPNAPVVFVIGLCLALVGLAYFNEYLRNRKKMP